MKGLIGTHRQVRVHPALAEVGAPATVSVMIAIVDVGVTGRFAVEAKHLEKVHPRGAEAPGKGAHLVVVVTAGEVTRVV